jgi:hypothetical protein
LVFQHDFAHFPAGGVISAFALFAGLFVMLMLFNFRHQTGFLTGFGKALKRSFK